MTSKEEQALVDAIAENMGFLGVGSLQIGSTIIHATTPGTLTECVGAGDTIRVGDVVIDTHRGESVLCYPHRIEAIFASDRSDTGPTILSRAIDAGIDRGTTSYCAWGGGWCREFKVLNQSDVDAWFAKDKALREDGWHYLPDSRGRVLTRSVGVPIEIERSSVHQPLKFVVAAAEQMLGFDIAPCRTYANKTKLNVKVKSSVRRQPPKI